MLKLFDNKSHLQMANSADNIATAILDMVFPVLKQCRKTIWSLQLNICFELGGIAPYPHGSYRPGECPWALLSPS